MINSPASLHVRLSPTNPDGNGLIRMVTPELRVESELEFRDLGTCADIFRYEGILDREDVSTMTRSLLTGISTGGAGFLAVTAAIDPEHEDVISSFLKTGYRQSWAGRLTIVEAQLL